MSPPIISRVEFNPTAVPASGSNEKGLVTKIYVKAMT